MSNSAGRLFVISGPSGVGKSTICGEVSRRTGIPVSVSATTRPSRGEERDGIDYTFLSHDEFKSRIDSGWFYEYAGVYGHLYGTPKDAIEDGLARGDDFLLDIDVQGARSVKGTCERAVLIFVTPPGMEELEQRLSGRGTETPEERDARLSRAASEMRCRGDFDYTVLNADIDSTVSEILGIIESERKNARLVRC